MDFFNVISLQEAHARLQQAFPPQQMKTEQIALLKAQNRFLAEDIIAAEDVPAFDRSTVDGYAVHTVDTFGAGEGLPSLLQCVGSVQMGQAADLVLQSGQAVAVPTGGMLPEGADGVVMIEYTEQFDANTIAIYKPLSPGENCIVRGDDLRQGAMVLKKGRRLTLKNIAVLAACGIHQVTVYQPLRFAVISTGDEIIDIDQQPQLGQIRDVNSYGLSSMIAQWGGQVVARSIEKDDYAALRTAMLAGLQQADVVLTSGGSSVGERDYTYRLMQELCGMDILLKGIAMKPGKPTIAGKAQDKLVLGLPGHPVAAMIVFRVLLSNLLRHWGLQVEETIIPAKLTLNLPSSPGKTTFQMVRLQQERDGFAAAPVFGKSGMTHLLGESDGYIQLENHQEGLKQGQQVFVHIL